MCVFVCVHVCVKCVYGSGKCLCVHVCVCVCGVRVPLTHFSAISASLSLSYIAATLPSTAACKPETHASLSTELYECLLDISRQLACMKLGSREKYQPMLQHLDRTA